MKVICINASVIRNTNHLLRKVIVNSGYGLVKNDTYTVGSSFINSKGQRICFVSELVDFKLCRRFVEIEEDTITKDKVSEIAESFVETIN